MNPTTYRTPSSPFPRKTMEQYREEAYDVSNAEHPAREDIAKCVGSHNLVAVVEEDVQTLATMKHMNGLVAFLCTLTKNGTVISQGRGSAILNPTNRYIQRAVHCAFHSSIVDSIIQSTKILGTFSDSLITEYPTSPQGGATKASEKQVEYLRTLISRYVSAPSERRQLLASLDTVSKAEACEMITRLRQ